MSNIYVVPGKIEGPPKSILLTKELKKSLKIFCSKNKIRESDVIRHALNQFLLKNNHNN